MKHCKGCEASGGEYDSPCPGLQDERVDFRLAGLVSAAQTYINSHRKYGDDANDQSHR